MATSQPTIFISYRRADSADISGRIYDRLVERYGRERIFKDVDSIPPGVKFPDYIAESIQASDVVLVVIGPQWLNISSGFAQRRLDDPADFVRVEIETALRLGVAVIPVLVGGATMPPARRLPESLRPLLQQNGVDVRRDPDFNNDMRRVLAAVDYWQAQPRRPAPPTPARAEPPATLAPQPAAPAPAETPAHTSARAPAVATAIAEDATSAETRARRPAPRLAPMLALGSAVALIAIVGSVLLSPPVQRLLRPSTPNTPNTPNTQATRTALAHSQTATAIALANAGAYTPPSGYGIGPCAAPWETWGNGIRTYWQTIDTIDRSLTSCDTDGKVATFRQAANGGGGGAVFHGSAGTNTGYPPKFTASYTIVFSDGSTPACAQLQADYGDDTGETYPVPAGRAIRICSTGYWTDLISKAHGTYPIQNATAKVAITVAGGGTTFNINGTNLDLGNTQGSTGAFDRLQIAATSYQPGPNDGTLGSIAVSDFKIVPIVP